MNDIPESVDKLLQDIDDAVLLTIARRIKAVGSLTSYQLQQAANLTTFYNEDLRTIEQKLAKLTKRTVKEIHKIFRDSAKEVGMEIAEQFGQAYHKSEARDDLVQAAVASASVGFMNLAKTTVMEVGGLPIREAYIHIINRAILAAQTGAENYYTLMRNALRDLGDGLGVNVTYESGHKRRLDSAVRMNILDGMRSLNRDIRRQQGERFGATGVYIMPHALCAEDHLPFQGKEYTYEEFNELNARLPRPIATGQYNCGHVAYDRVVGDPLPYTEEQLAEINAYGSTTVTWNGKEMTRYEASQKQRAAETSIRSLKQKRAVCRAAGDDEWELRYDAYIKTAQKKYRLRCKESGLEPRPKRYAI